jgi:hypothetical protein
MRATLPQVTVARNEQGMVHAPTAFARVSNRLSTLACTSSIGPGATNMVTGAALATINRIPVLLLPGDIFATRVASPVLQQLENPGTYDMSVNDTFRQPGVHRDRPADPGARWRRMVGCARRCDLGTRDYQGRAGRVPVSPAPAAPLSLTCSGAPGARLQLYLAAGSS